MEKIETQIFGLNDNPYFISQFNYWAMDISFSNNYLLNVNNIIALFLGESMNEANFSISNIHDNFEMANIHEGDNVIIDIDPYGYVQRIYKENSTEYINVLDGLSLKTF